MRRNHQGPRAQLTAMRSGTQPSWRLPLARRVMSHLRPGLVSTSAAEQPPRGREEAALWGGAWVPAHAPEGLPAQAGLCGRTTPDGPGSEGP